MYLKTLSLQRSLKRRRHTPRSASCGQSEAVLHLKLNRQAMSIPAGTARCIETTHRLIAAWYVLEEAGEHVWIPGLPLVVGGPSLNVNVGCPSRDPGSSGRLHSPSETQYLDLDFRKAGWNQLP
jgi:hypothetical protein